MWMMHNGSLELRKLDCVNHKHISLILLCLTVRNIFVLMIEWIKLLGQGLKFINNWNSKINFSTHFMKHSMKLYNLHSYWVHTTKQIDSSKSKLKHIVNVVNQSRAFIPFPF